MASVFGDIRERSSAESEVRDRERGLVGLRPGILK